MDVYSSAGKIDGGGTLRLLGPGRTGSLWASRPLGPYYTALAFRNAVSVRRRAKFTRSGESYSAKYMIMLPVYLTYTYRKTVGYTGHVGYNGRGNFVQA